MASLTLIPHIGINFHVTPWTLSGRDAYDEQWGTAVFNWPEVFRRHSEPDRLELAIWSPEQRLCALALGLTTGRAVELRFLEGCATEGCPLRGFRAAIALEVTACYAQLRGKTEIRVTPISDRLRKFYVELYGFEEMQARGMKPYFRRVI